MSGLSEAREKIIELEARVAVLEQALLKILNDHSIPMHEVGEPRNPIGFRQTKRRKRN